MLIEWQLTIHAGVARKVVTKPMREHCGQAMDVFANASPKQLGASCARLVA
jgi:hypothetical protein